MESTEFKLSEKGIKASEYQMLRNTTDWPAFNIQAVEGALEKDLFSVCVTHKGQVVGMGRIIGDGVLYFYIQDVIVLPAYRGKGVGDLIMRSLEGFIHRNGRVGS
ncbi:MAG TPA: GNAT family N-acetyltransferase, partial [Eudoraea sp.]|nr:GNAT family N-acetyltransferase [Eudoraea sp.]